MNPYVKLFVNGELVLESPKKSDKIYANDDVTYHSDKIPKNSTIKLQIWGSNSCVLWAKDELIFNSEGDVESFLAQPIRKDPNNPAGIDTIETISFWRNEYV